MQTIPTYQALALAVGALADSPNPPPTLVHRLATLLAPFRALPMVTAVNPDLVAYRARSNKSGSLTLRVRVAHLEGEALFTLAIRPSLEHTFTLTPQIDTKASSYPGQTFAEKSEWVRETAGALRALFHEQLTTPTRAAALPPLAIVRT